MHDLAAATPDLTSTFKVVNYLLDQLAYNPPGQEEGYLFWVAWANHIGNQIFTTQDAHGPIRRGLFITTCQDVPVLNQVAQANPLLGTLTDLLAIPKQNCPQLDPGPVRRRIDAEGRPLLRSHRRHGRLRAVVLRPAAVPVARVRRHDPAEAEGLPLHRVVLGGDAARPGGRRPHLRRPGRQGQDDRARQEDRPLERRDPARLALRAAAVGRQGDPAPEDAARRDLRRADARHAGRRRRSPRAAGCATTQISPTVELDEIFRAFDPQTREAFQVWMQTQAQAIKGHGRDINDALGNLGPFAEDASVAVDILHRQDAALRRLISNTGVVFGALTERGDQLRGLIENSNTVFATTARAQPRAAGGVRRAADVRARVAADAQPARPLRGRHQPARHPAAARPRAS